MSRKSAEQKHLHTADEHQQELIRLMREFGYSHNPQRVFSDFVELSALAISNSVDKSQFDAREKRYLDIVKGYKRDEVERFGHMLGALVETLERRLANGNLTDVLGETFMMMELGNDRAGQFFTPYAISKLMASLTMMGDNPEIQKNGFIRLQEPACGAAGMVIAAAEALAARGHNFQETLHATGIDIDERCVHMAYLQLSLLGIPAIVVHGNALTMEIWGTWRTPIHVLGGWDAKLRRGYTLASLERAAANLAATDIEPIAESRVDQEDDHASVVMEMPVVDVPASVNPVPVSSLETAGATTTALADMFEDAISQNVQPTIFDKVDQMMLF